MELKHVTKKFDQNTVLNDISFSFNQSHIVGLIGKNGAGKTTLMKVMNGNITDYSGTVQYDDDERLGYLIEQPKFYRNKTGLYNLKFFSRLLGEGFDSSFTEKIIERFDMKGFINKKTGKYSMGMKQRLAIAISLMSKPNYLILDEPTNGMDPDSSIDILTTLKEFAQDYNIKILISSHKLEDIELICDRAIFLKNSNIVADKELTESGKVEGYTMLQLKKADFTKAQDLLKDEMSIHTVIDAEHALYLDLQQDLSNMLEKLAQHHIYPMMIDNRYKSLRDTYFSLNKEER
ncbi:ABC transporter ATP-binding protein [Staphylococcus sp. SQ8-PEA]|uniref:ABC transporter ATP-binding protein n=1 Tax=Staphylococcus marylandisciuri TaxID=2981529 RepID=A0ABT2QN59_9STAP|nr:ABC transporter ATP-binding protein [Staphylococcus marylandisciuri]MCU5745413.1 ABC transporter ATP-binding protein [Staphylococcus marylandisciuri]